MGSEPSPSVAAPQTDRSVGPHDMVASAERASALLKVLANPDRLVILCQLAEGEKTVTELGAMLKLRQPTLSQQLARLRADELVQTRRAGKHIYYSLASPEATRVIELLYELFCAVPAPRTAHEAPLRRGGARAAS